jgi:hypothetical protein
VNRIEEIAEVLELIPGTPYAKKIRCKLCGDMMYEVDGGSAAQDEVEMTRMAAHLSIQHQIKLDYHKCDDPNCLD